MIDLALAIVVAAAACLVVTELLAMGTGANNTQVPVAERVESSRLLADVGSRSDYEGIVKTGLFGPAGKTAQKDAPPPPAEPEAPEEVETKLQLRLWGTAATLDPKDPLASAVVENQEDSSVRAYFISGEILDKVTLEEIFQRKVILFNERTNSREILRTEDEKENRMKLAAASSSGPRPSPLPSRPAPRPESPVSDTRITINKAEFIQELFVNYADLVTQIKPEPVRDEHGKMVGITASNLESVPLAKMLGVKDGDILQTVNNEMIDSEQKIIELVNKYRNSNVFRIGVLRDGKPRVITYRMD